MAATQRRGRQPVFCLLLLLAGTALCAAQSTTNTRDADLQAKFRLLGNQVLPFTSEKQNAVIVGVANALGSGILASDIVLTVYATYNSITAYGNSSSGSSNGRRLLQQQTAFPAADIGLNITTSQALAANQSQALLAATNQTYLLSSAIGSQGLQTQLIVLQSTDIAGVSRSPPPPSPSPVAPPPAGSPPPPASPPPAASPPPPQAAAAAAQSTPPAASSSPTTSGSAATDSASKSSGGGTNVGAIVGGVIGGIAVLAAIGLFVFLRRRRASYQQRGEVIDYFSDLGKQGSRDAGAGALPVTATSAAETQPEAGAAAPRIPPPRRASREHNHVFVPGVNEKAEVPVTEIAEVPAGKPDV